MLLRFAAEYGFPIQYLRNRLGRGGGTGKRPYIMPQNVGYFRSAIRTPPWA